MSTDDVAQRLYALPLNTLATIREISGLLQGAGQPSEPSDVIELAVEALRLRIIEVGSVDEGALFAPGNTAAPEAVTTPQPPERPRGRRILRR